MSTFCSSKWVAKQCRSVWSETVLSIPAASLALWKMRLSWRAVRWLTGFWPGNSQPPGNITPVSRPARHQARKSSRRSSASMA